ncbi:MAG: methyl-accepting chemotaxis protein [Treponema sp.]|nr:methyl-accepting chemotaxis protein [Treponema sp.]
MQNFEKTVLKKNLVINFVASIIIFFYDMTFIHLPIEKLLQTYISAASIIGIGLCIFSPILNKLVTFSLSNKLLYWQTQETTEKQRTDLFMQLTNFPYVKATEIYCMFTFCTGMLVLCFILFMNVEIKESLIFLLIGCVTSYFAYIAAFYSSQNICSKITKDVVSQGISQQRIILKHLFGISLTHLFVIYIILPIICIFTLIFLFCIFNPNHLLQITIISIINCAVLILLITVFFKKIHRYATDMKASMLRITSHDIANAAFIPTDLSSELAYTQFLINHVISLFHTMLQKNNNISCEINTSSLELSSIAQQTNATAQTQSDSIAAVVKSMEATKELSNTISLKSDEVVHVAEKTVTDIDNNVEQIHANLSIMKDIITFNKMTIIGIQNLYNKILSVKDIINLIDTVADQTKIIAFNAEIEAGNIQNDIEDFYNVSKEIRQLANSTMTMTKQIKEQIEDILTASDVLITTGHSCMEKIQEGDDLSAQLEKRFTTIQTSAQRTLVNAKQIKQHIIEQTTSFAQILKTLEQIHNSIVSINNGTLEISDSVLKMQQYSEKIQTISTGVITTQSPNEGDKQ